MTPRQARLSVDVFTGVIIASVALALANLTWRLQGEPGIGPAAAPVVARGGESIDIRPLIALAPFGTAVQVVNSGGSEGAVRLKAIFLATPMEASVVLLALPDGKVASYGVGSAIGGGVIERIEAEQITLRMPNGVQTVGFNPESQPLAGAGAPAATGSTPSTTTSAPGPSPPPPPATGADAVRALIPPSLQGRQAPAPPPSLPVTTGYAPVGGGLRIGASPPPALLAAGILPGDVIERVNGSRVAAGSERELMAGAMAAGAARVDLVRDGRPVSITVPVR